MSNMMKRSWLAGWAICAVAGLGIIAALSASASSRAPEGPELPFRPPDVAAPSAKADIQGFTISVLDARASGLTVDVEIWIDGREEFGEELVLLGGPAIIWSDGTETTLSRGTADGRHFVMTFDRPPNAELSAGDQVKVIFHGAAPRGQSGQAPAPEVQIARMPVVLLASLSEARNPVVRSLATQVPAGPGSIIMDAVLRDGGDLRVVGRVVGFSRNDAALLSMRETKLLTSSGESISPTNFRFSAESEGGQFMFDFKDTGAAVQALEVRLSAEPGQGRVVPPSLTTLAERPAEVRLDLIP